MQNLIKNLAKSSLFVSVVLFTIFLGGCSKKTVKETVRIGVSVANFENIFWSYSIDGMKNYQQSLGKKIEVTYLDAKVDIEKQEEQVKYFIKNKMDVLMVFPVDTEYTSNITKMATDAKIPLVYFNQYPQEFEKKEIPKNVYFIGPNDTDMGKLQMEYLAEKLNGKGNIAILMGAFRNQSTFKRTEGVEEIVSRYPELKIIEKESARWLRPMSTTVVEQWLKSGEKIDAIVANNDEMAIGAIRALEKYNKPGEIMVCGIDFTKDALAELKSKKLTATISQDPYEQGEKALETAFKIATGEEIEEVDNKIWIPTKLVTQENYPDFLK